MAHIPGNDICESSASEGCICHLSESEQWATRTEREVRFGSGAEDIVRALAQSYPVGVPDFSDFQQCSICYMCSDSYDEEPEHYRDCAYQMALDWINSHPGGEVSK